MKSDNFYKIAIILLLLLNLGTLGYIWLGQKPQGEHGRPPHPDQVIIERLKLTGEQQETFEGLKHEHHSQMVQLQENSGKLHKELFALLQQEQVDQPKKDSLLHLIQNVNMNKEQVTFEHFQKLRAILTPGQKAEFDEFVEDISRRIMGPHRKDRP